MEIRKNTTGSLKISEKVLCTIAGAAATEVEGVAGLAPGPVDFSEILKNPSPSASIKLSLSDEIAHIDVSIKLKSGAKISQTAAAVQRAVKQAVQNMTGIAVQKVNVHIAGIVFDQASE